MKIAEYMDYMGIKKKLIELEKKDENLVKRGPIQNKLIESKHEAAEVAITSEEHAEEVGFFL